MRHVIRQHRGLLHQHTSVGSSRPLMSSWALIPSAVSPPNTTTARCGTLFNVATPNFLLYTTSGLPTHVTSDQLQYLFTSEVPLQINAADFVSYHQISTDPTIAERLRLSRGTLSVLTAADALATVGPANDKALTVRTLNGNAQLSVDDFVRLIVRGRPDVAVIINDQAHSTANRSRKAVDRTIKWIQTVTKQCRRTADESAAENAAKRLRLDESAVSAPPSPLLFGAVVGGLYDASRILCARAVAECAVDGFCFVGDMNDSAFAASVRHLPASKPRLRTNATSLAHVLTAVSMGVDLFDSSYIQLLTRAARAAVFPTELSALMQSGGDNATPFFLDLYDPTHRLANTPIAESCHCHTCTHHTRAYLHHLCVVNEMSAKVLLDLHNIYHYQKWFHTMRYHISQGTFVEYHSALSRLLDGCDDGALSASKFKPVSSKGARRQTQNAVADEIDEVNEAMDDDQA